MLTIKRYLNLGVPTDEIHLVTGGPSTQIEQPVDKKTASLPPSTQSFIETSDRVALFSWSVNLVGCVLECTQALHAGECFDTEKFKALDAAIQSLLMQVLNQSTHCWEESCETIGLCLW